jgi:predicted ATPase
LDLEARLAALGRVLAARDRTLFILDNLEQASDACRRVIPLMLERAPRLGLLVTSQHRLAISGEIPYEVRGLRTEDARALFKDRALHSRSGVQAEGTDPELISDIVRKLDGHPLGLEFAAARVGVFALETLHERLNDRFTVLTAAHHDAPLRHSTLRATIERSWMLLTHAEQTFVAVECRSRRFRAMKPAGLGGPAPIISSPST